jgi:hypothetical protein
MRNFMRSLKGPNLKEAIAIDNWVKAYIALGNFLSAGQAPPQRRPSVAATHCWRSEWRSDRLFGGDPHEVRSPRDEMSPEVEMLRSLLGLQDCFSRRFSSMALIGRFFGRSKKEAPKASIGWASDKAVRRAAKRIFAKYKATILKLAE